MSKKEIQINYFKVDDFFVRYEEHKNVESTEKVVIENNYHHVLFLDRSGSMWGEMEHVKTELKAFVRRALKVGDTLSIYVFNHTFELILKHQLITSIDESFFVNFIDFIINKELYASGMTNISAPVNNMADINLVSYMMQLKKLPIKVYIHSDGHDNQSGGKQNVLRAFERIKNFVKIGNTHVQGFGDFYDKDLLTSIARTMNGIFMHVNNATEYADEIFRFATNRGAKELTKIKVSEYGEFTFVLNNSDNSIINIEQGKTEFDIDSDSFTVVTVTKNRPTDCKIVAKPEELEIKVALATSIVASRNNALDFGIEVLSEITKDLYFAELLYSSQSPVSFAKAEKEIQLAIGDETKRYVDGKGKYLKNPDRTSVIDIIEEIAADGNVLLARPKSYSGVKFKNKKLKVRPDGTEYPKFKSDNAGWVLFNDKTFVYNDTSVNISIKFTEFGSVEIDKDDVFKHNLQPVIKNVRKYNNYTIVGFLGEFGYKDEKGIPVIVIKNISEKLYNWLVEEKVIRKSTKWEATKEFRLNMQKFPIVKRSKMEMIASIDYAKLIADQKIANVNTKVLNYFLNQSDEEDEMTTRFGEAEAEVLKERYCIDGHGNYKSKEIALDADIAKKILEKLNFDIEANLPLNTTKAKFGQKIPYEDLSMPQIFELLYLAKEVDRIDYPIFKGKLAVVGGNSFDNLPSMNAIKDSLLFKGDYVIKFLNERNIPFDMPLDNKGKVKAKPSIDDKKLILENSGVDKALMKVEDLFENHIENQKAISGNENKPDVELMENFLDVFGITNTMEVTILNKLIELYLYSKNMGETEKIKYFNDELTKNKVEMARISKAKFELKVAVLLGTKGYTDQDDRLNPKEIQFDYRGFKFEYLPSIKDEVEYLGSLEQILNRLGITV